MANEKKASKAGEKAGKEAVKSTLQALAKPDAKKAVVAATKAPSEVAVKAQAEVQVQAPKVVATVKTEPQAKAEAPQAKAAKEAVKATPEEVSETPKVEAKAEVKKEADPNKEFVDGIMTEMSLKGASKKRLIKKLAEQYNFDKQRVLFKLKRALITERYAAAHEAGH